MKRKVLVTLTLAVLILSMGIMASCGDNKMKQATITSVWPDNEFTRAIPNMRAGELFSYTEYENGDRMMFIITDVTHDDFDFYRDAMKYMDYKETKVDRGDGSITVEFKNKHYRVSLFYGGANFTLRVYRR